MDKIILYKNIVREIIEEIAIMTPSDEETETQVLIDDERGHYVLFSIGWHEITREYVPFVHLDVRQTGKVWIQQDSTTLKIALWLIEKGIPKEDIVLAFHAKERRELIPDFAVE